MRRRNSTSRSSAYDVTINDLGQYCLEMLISSREMPKTLASGLTSANIHASMQNFAFLQNTVEVG